MVTTQCDSFPGLEELALEPSLNPRKLTLTWSLLFNLHVGQMLQNIATLPNTTGLSMRTINQLGLQIKMLARTKPYLNHMYPQAKTQFSKKINGVPFFWEYNGSDKSKLSPFQAQKPSLQKSQSSHHHLHIANHVSQVNSIFRCTQGLREATAGLLNHSETCNELSKVVIKGKA